MNVRRWWHAIVAAGVILTVSGLGAFGVSAQESGITFHVSPTVRHEVAEEIQVLLGRILEFQRTDLHETLAAPVDVYVRGSRREILDTLIDSFGYAEDRAAAVVARAGFLAIGHSILIDAGSPLFLDPPRLVDRAAVVAHELAHIFHNDLMGGSGRAPVWMLEGFAVRMELRTLAHLGLRSTVGGAERLNLTLFALRRGELIPLADLELGAGWNQQIERFGPDRVYAQSYVAVEYLVQSHTLEATLGFFRAFRESRVASDNFRTAFGVDVQTFQQEFEQYLATLAR